MKLVTAPQRIETANNMFSIFLAGSIELSKARDWQTDVQVRLQDLNVTIFNPRREDWGASWKQDISDQNFSAQVNWELDYLEKSDLILFYFAPETKAPITLMELGLFASSGKYIVCCPEGYWRRGNVQIVCQRHNISLTDNMDQLIEMAASQAS